MADSRPLPTGGPTAGGDEFDDDLFNYDVDDPNDPFSENYVSEVAKKVAADKERERTSGAHLDEEVKVTRKQIAPRVKLDENRLLSANGIPKLRNKAKHHLKFRGKGHEYSDTTKLLSFYQLWLDDLFPKARFHDALAMVEKMGHKKRMQMMRMEWINEGKPKPDNDDDLFEEPILPPRDDDGREKTVPIAPIFEQAAGGRPKTPDPKANEDEEMEDLYGDLYGASPKAARTQPAEGAVQTSSLFGNAKIVAEDEPPEDDLDALLAEEEMLQATNGNAQPALPTSKVAAVEASIDYDEEAAMAEMDIW